MWWTNTAEIIELCQSVYPKVYWGTITSPPQLHQDLVNLVLMRMIRLAIVNNTQHLKMWLEGQLGKVITQHSHWQPQGSFRIHLLHHKRTWGKLISIWMITTLTNWRLAVHFGYRISPTGGINKRKHTNSLLISLMWHTIYSLSYHSVSEWRPVLPLGEMCLDGGNQKPQARPFT